MANDHIFTIQSDLADGSHVEIAIEIVGADDATLTVRQWAAATPPPAAPTVTPYLASHITRLPDNTGIACRVSIATVICSLTQSAAGQPQVSIEKDFLFVRTTSDYPVSAQQSRDIENFIAQSGFPQG